MAKVNYGTVVSANVRVDNSTDEAREYEISAIANLNHETPQNFDSGTVKKSNICVATWNAWADTNLSINYTTLNANTIYAISNAIIDFIDEVKKTTADTPITVSSNENQISE